MIKATDKAKVFISWKKPQDNIQDYVRTNIISLNMIIHSRPGVKLSTAAASSAQPQSYHRDTRSLV